MNSKKQDKCHNQDQAHTHSHTPTTRSSTDNYQRALTQIKNGQFHDATLSLRKCLSLDPEFTEAHIRLSGIFQNTGQIEESDKHLKVVLSKNPNHVEALVRHGSNLALSGNIGDAQKCFEKAMDLRPNNSFIAASLAGLYIRKGHPKEALKTITPFLSDVTVHEAIAVVFADVCKHVNRCNEATELLEEVVRRPKLHKDGRSNVLFALGKLYDGSRDYKKAFECFSKANSLKQATFNSEELSAYTDALIATWNLHFQSQLAHATARFGQAQPIFIVGMPRSGTTLVEQILSRHPDIYGAGELKFIPDIIKILTATAEAGNNYPECIKHADKTTLDMISGEYLDKLDSISGRSFIMVTDKLPGNFWNLGFIKLLFPLSKIIHCKRNTLDVCLSNYFTNFSDGSPYSFNLKNTGIYYRQYEKIMAHWENTLQLPMFNIQYEDLIKDQDRLCRALVNYCGLEWSDKCLSPHDNQRSVTTSSFNQVREAIYSTSIGRWKHYDMYLGALRMALEDHKCM